MKRATSTMITACLAALAIASVIILHSAPLAAAFPFIGSLAVHQKLDCNSKCLNDVVRNLQRWDSRQFKFNTQSRSSSSFLFMQSIPVNEGSVTVSRTYIPSSSNGDSNANKHNPQTQNQEAVTEKYTISTKIYRPMSLTSRQAAPILVLHGGPSVPSNYLYPLVDVIPYRSIIYYDQLGCGQSSEPNDVRAYSIEKSVDDLEEVIKKLGLRRFHIYGQSFGGILAFEYLKRVAERNTDHNEDEGCLSVILSSSPTSVSLVEETASKLIEALKIEDEDDEEIILARFKATHQCRTKEMPTPLLDAYANAGTVWRGTTAISDYVAKSPTENAKRMPSVMVMRGEYDFVNEKCVEGWKGCFNHNFVRMKVLDGCSHHGLLENGRLYGEIVNDFLSEYD